MMVMILRTGELFHASTARLAGMTAAALSQDHSSPQVASQFEQLFWQGHWLLEIREEVANQISCQGIS